MYDYIFWSIAALAVIVAAVRMTKWDANTLKTFGTYVSPWHFVDRSEKPEPIDQVSEAPIVKKRNRKRSPISYVGGLGRASILWDYQPPGEGENDEQPSKET